MAYIQGHARDQMLLLPASIEDYVAADNPVRFIEAFVDELDLSNAGFMRSQPKATGRPGYAPADLLKLYLNGYLNRVRSSRRLEAEAGRNLEVLWLLRGMRPDFKTIADFRRDNRAAFKAVFRAFVLLCRKLDLFGPELVAVGGTRLKAVNSRARNFTKAKLDKYIKSADERLEKYLAHMRARTLRRASVPESRPMSPAHSAVRPFVTAASPRSGFAMTRLQTAITALPNNGSIRATAGSRTAIRSCLTQTRAYVAGARSRPSAHAETSAASRDGKARQCSIAWLSASLAGQRS